MFFVPRLAYVSMCRLWETHTQSPVRPLGAFLLQNWAERALLIGLNEIKH